MFDNNVFTEGSCKNVAQDGKVIGYSMLTNITYYRGIPLSMINEIAVKTDGQDVPRENIRFSPDGQEYFTLDEMTTVTTFKWEYDMKATVLVLKEGGLASGEHDIELVVNVRTAYIPVPLRGVKARKVRIA